MLSWANIDPVRVRVLPNTVRPVFTPGPVCGTTLAKYNLVGKKIILTVARINKADEYKGHARVIRALAAVRQTCPDIIYVVAGDGDGRGALEELVSQLRLQSAFRFLGRINDEEVLALYRSSHVFIMPSTKEGFGIVFVEAAATGLPVIGGNCDGSTDALADGRIGRTIAPDSPDEIVTALIDALTPPRRTNAEEVQRFIYSNFAAHVDELVGNLVH